MDMGREADDLATARPGPGGRRHAERRPRSARPRAAPPTRHTTRWPDAGPHATRLAGPVPNSAGATHYGAARGVLTLGAGYCCRAHGRRGFKLWWGTDDPATRDGRMVGVLTHDAG